MNININLEPSNESLAIIDKVKDVFKKTKVTNNYNDILKMMKPGDCVGVSLLDSSFKSSNLPGRVINFIFKTVQRAGGVSSIKLVIDHEHIQGYGVNKSTDFDKVNAHWFFSKCSRIVLLRHKKMTDTKRVALVRGALDRKDMRYNVSEVITSSVNRIFGKNTIGRDDIINKPSSFVTALICSSMIVWLYKGVNLNITPKKMSLIDMWPSDILIHKDMEKVIQYKKI